jgi:protein ImuB
MRVACLDLPGFPLQLVWRREPAWRAQPVVVVDDDRPQGAVLWACERARASGVLAGQRYAVALSLCGELRARVVSDAELAEATTELRAALHRLSPSVEPGEAGTFWLDGEGLGQVFPDGGGEGRGRAWGDAIARAIGELGYRGTVVVGFSRFATYAIARAAATPRSGRRRRRCRWPGSTSLRSCARRWRGSG